MTTETTTALTAQERAQAIRTYADYVAFLDSLSPAQANIWAEVLPVPER
jgi:N-acyl-D-aspartate/D-glutamate deacylase